MLLCHGCQCDIECRRQPATFWHTCDQFHRLCTLRALHHIYRRIFFKLAGSLQFLTSDTGMFMQLQENCRRPCCVNRPRERAPAGKPCPMRISAVSWSSKVTNMQLDWPICVAPAHCQIFTSSLNAHSSSANLNLSTLNLRVL